MANIVIMPGGFHPFHAGHAALYNSIKEKYGDSDVYVAASNNQKERPFPFEIKEKLAQLSGVRPGEFVQVKSPFVPTEITNKYDPDKDTIVFVRSEKDKNEYPKPGAVKKDGSPGYFQHIDTAKRGAQPFSKVGYMDYLPVKEFAGITSATQIRDSWPKLNDSQREEFVTHIYPNLKGNDKLIKNVVKLLSKGMSLNEGLAYIDKHGKRVEYTRPDLPSNIEDSVIDWFNTRDKYTKAMLQSKGYKVDVDDKFDNIVITDKKGRKYTVSTDDAMSKLIQQAYSEPMTEDQDDTLLDTKRARAILQLYTRTNGFNLRKIITSRKRGGADNERIMTAMVMPDSKTFGRDDIDNLSDEFQKRFRIMVPRMTVTGNGQYLNINPVVVKKVNEAFVDPDQSKQYWNHDAQKVGVGGQIEFPLTDKPNLNGRRQGFNEGEERSDIETAAYEWLLDYKSRHPEADYEELYSALKNVSHDDLGTQELDYFIGEPLGLNMDNKNLIVDAVLAQMTEGMRRYRYEESIEKIRNMIKESSDEQKSKSTDLHRKLFELMEEERNNIVKLRGFGREQDKTVPDLNIVRKEREKEKQRNQGEYDKKRQQQYAYLRKIQEILFELHEDFAEMEQLGLLPVEMKQNFENVKELIDFVENYSADDFPFTDDDGNLLESLHIKTMQLKEYFGGWRDRQAPRTLRKETPKLSPNAFWNKIDLSETADYIEEK
jgi:hypothetical protein